MKTLTPSKARKNITDLLARAARGEDIGIVLPSTGQIIALRPVEVYSTDYALVEYGIASAEMKRIEANLVRQTRAERKAGKLTEWKP